MTSGRTRRIQFSRVRINSPAREDGDEEETLASSGPSSSEESFFSTRNPVTFGSIGSLFWGTCEHIRYVGYIFGKDQLALPVYRECNHMG